MNKKTCYLYVKPKPHNVHFSFLESVSEDKINTLIYKKNKFFFPLYFLVSFILNINKIYRNDIFILIGANLLLYGLLIKIFSFSRKKIILLNADPLFYDIKTISNFKKFIIGKLLIIIDGVIFIQGNLKKLDLTFVKDKSNFLAKPFINDELFNELSSIKNNNSKNFVYIGRLSKEKNIDLMIDYFIELHKLDSDIKLNIVGSGPLEDKVNIRIKNISFIKNIGYISDIKKIYEKNDFLLLFSNYDSFPVVILEALTAGLIPIVSSNVGSKVLLNKDLVIDFNSNNINNLNNIKTIIDNRNIYKKEILNKKTYIKNNYLKDISVKKFREEYNKLLNNIYE